MYINQLHTQTHTGKEVWIHISRMHTNMKHTHIRSHLVVSVGVGYSWEVVGGDTAVCNQWQGSGECRGWVLDCSAGPYTGYWTQSGAPQTGWTKWRTEQGGRR